MMNFLDRGAKSYYYCIGGFRCNSFYFIQLFYSTDGSSDHSDVSSLPGESIKNTSETVSIDKFWKEVYSSMSVEREDSPTDTSLYNYEVMELLGKFRGKYQKIMDDIKSNKNNKSIDLLFDFQRYIEGLTMSFSISNIYNQYRPLMRMLTCNSLGEELQPAQDFLKEKQCGLEEDEVKALNGDHNIHTIEALIVYVFANLFSKQILEGEPRVKVASLVQHLDDAIRSQFHLCPSRKKTIGRNLIRFLVDRNFITIVSVTMKFKNTLNQKGPKKVNYPCVECNFNLKLLPLRMNLPMIVSPRKWNLNPKRLERGGDIKLNELTGGYLTISSKEYNHFSLLASRDTDHFNIILKDIPALCSTLNNLQSTAFRINETMLDFILHNRSLLESEGMLMDRRIAYVKMRDSYPVLHKLYFNNRAARKIYKNISDLELEFSKRVQQARFEDFILDIANAYRGYEFYLPAFLDFRGRIYRTGLLHFHERDIAKSLILFSNKMDKTTVIYNETNLLYSAAAAFKYKKHDNYSNAASWYKRNLYPLIFDNDSTTSLIEFSKNASDPFQFLSKVLLHMDNRISLISRYVSVPVSQDASASAYQIMSYFLLNAEIGFQTNLLPNKDGQIQDIYLFILSGLRTFLEELMPERFPVIEPRLNRKLVKSLFMPMIYGKTVASMIDDITASYGDLLHYHECKLLATNCWNYLKIKYPDILAFMNMINNIGYLCSYIDRAVIYDTEYFRTTQDYFKYKKEVLRVKLFKKESKKTEERKVTFRFPTKDRDSRKTGISTCVNFIHQKDAYIAMKLLSKVFHNKRSSIYTVHDNFITPLSNSYNLAQWYTEIFANDLPHPLILVNHFILINMRADLSELDKPISNLKELIMNQVNINHKKVKTIEKKVDETVKQYYYYVKTVTKSNQYTNFRFCLLAGKGGYSLHF